MLLQFLDDEHGVAKTEKLVSVSDGILIGMAKWRGSPSIEGVATIRAAGKSAYQHQEG